MKIREIETQVYQYRESGMIYRDIGSKLCITGSTARDMYMRAERIYNYEKEHEVARLDIELRTFEKLLENNIWRKQKLENYNVDLMSVEGLVDAINTSKIIALNKDLGRNGIFRFMIEDIIQALEKEGYTMNHDYGKASNNISTEITNILNENKISIVEFYILDKSGRRACKGIYYKNLNDDNNDTLNVYISSKIDLDMSDIKLAVEKEIGKLINKEESL